MRITWIMIGIVVLGGVLQDCENANRAYLRAARERDEARAQRDAANARCEERVQRCLEYADQLESVIGLCMIGEQR